MPDLTVGGHRIHFQWPAGYSRERETVIFLHDGLGAVGSWRDLPARLAATHGLNALVTDRWGYGAAEPRPGFQYQWLEAEVPVLVEMLDLLELERVHVIGHSDGGSIALLFAALHPVRVHTAITVGAHVSVEEKNLNGIRDMVAAHRAGNAPSWLYTLHGDNADALFVAWTTNWLSARHATWNIEKTLEDIACPLFVIQGADDEFGTPAHVSAILNRVPKAESWLVPGCGHTPFGQKPDEFLLRVGDFLRRNGLTGG